MHTGQHFAQNFAAIGPQCRRVLEWGINEKDLAGMRTDTPYQTYPIDDKGHFGYLFNGSTMPGPPPKRTREEIEKILRENLERKYEAYIKTPGEAERAAMMEALRLFNDLVIYDKTPEGM